MAAFTVIDHTELTGATASWSETSISSSYDHLLIVASIRSSKSSAYDKVGLQMGNGSLDTGTDYSMTNLQAFNTASGAPTSSRIATGVWDDLELIYIPADSATADTFGTVKIWIPNYTSSNFKQAIMTSTAPNASTSSWGIMITAGLWSSTDAVDCVGIKETGDDLMEYSTFTLYGVTGA